MPQIFWTPIRPPLGSHTLFGPGASCPLCPSQADTWLLGDRHQHCSPPPPVWQGCSVVPSSPSPQCTEESHGPTPLATSSCDRHLTWLSQDPGKTPDDIPHPRALAPPSLTPWPLAGATPMPPNRSPVFTLPVDSREIFPECRRDPVTLLLLSLHKDRRLRPPARTHVSPSSLTQSRCSQVHTSLWPLQHVGWHGVPTGAWGRAADGGGTCAHRSFGLGVLRTLSSSSRSGPLSLGFSMSSVSYRRSRSSSASGTCSAGSCSESRTYSEVRRVRAGLGGPLGRTDRKRT